MPIPKRKPTRLKGYDYSRNGVYFITICMRNREKILSLIQSDSTLVLLPKGKIMQEQLLALPHRYPTIHLDHFVIMPNHIHILLRMHSAQNEKNPTLSEIICAFKSLAARGCQSTKLFQPSFHEHIIRNEDDYQEIWEYIENNPAKWAIDKFYVE